MNAAATRESMELTLEAALAFVDSCYSEIDEEDECSDSSGSAAPASFAQATRKRIKRTSSESSDQSTPKPTKKRVRKQRQELLYLRVKVVEMQQMLDELQRGTGSGSASEASPSSNASSAVSSPVASSVPDAVTSSRQSNGPERAAPASATTTIGWASLAERQMQERERAEQENRQLKATLEGQLQLVWSLERLLIGQRDVEIPGLPSTAKRLQANVNNVSASEQALLRELKHELEDAYPRFEQELASSYLRDLTGDGGDIQVRNCADKGMHVEFTASKVLRHRFDATKRSMWRFMSKDGIRPRSYYYRELDAPRSDYVARSFGFNIATKHKNMDIYGTQVLEKIEHDDRVVLLWSAAVQPVQRTDASPSGIRFRERGWVELRAAPRRDNSNPATLVKTFVTFTPDLDESANASTMAVGAISDLVVDSVESNMHFGQAIVDQLVFDEEARVSNSVAVVV